MEHHFNIELAAKYGVDEAIFCHNLYFWVKQNKANKRNFHKGTYWTYNTMTAYAELFPYWNKKQIERLINRCREKGLILTDNFNQKGYDRTLWYAVTEKIVSAYEPTKKDESEDGENPENNDIPKTGNGENTDIPKTGYGNPENGTPIPDNKPDNKLKDKDLANKEKKNRQQDIKNMADSFYSTYAAGRWSKKQWNALINQFISEINWEKVNHPKAFIRTAIQGMAFKHDYKNGKVEHKFDNPIYYNWLGEN